MKKSLFIIILIAALILASCGGAITADTGTEAPQTESAPVDTETETEKAPREYADLNEEFIAKLRDGKIADMYPALSDDVKALMDEESFPAPFEETGAVYGNILDVGKTSKANQDGSTVYTTVLKYENADLTLTVTVKGASIEAFYYDVRITSPFEASRDGVTERYFLLESGDFSLNAVYTFGENEKDAPSVLLIPGSGPADFNESVGALAPFKDIARGLAKCGVNSLRFEKRTCRYPDKITAYAGLDEEYFIDCDAALAYLRTEGADEIYLLGHSLGGQIAAAVAKDARADGVILFNSSARHIADIAADQYDAMGIDSYRPLYEMADEAKAATDETASGKYYFGMSDYYLASYNKLDVIGSIKDSNIPFLIVNSRLDRQTFDEDIDLWETELAQSESVTIKIYDDVSHFGYKIDTVDPASIYRPAPFPDELINDFANFIKN